MYRKSSAARFVIQDYCPLAHSLAWELGQSYLDRGSRAFSGDQHIPYAINNDGDASVEAAELLLSSLTACVEAGYASRVGGFNRLRGDTGPRVMIACGAYGAVHQVRPGMHPGMPASVLTFRSPRKRTAFSQRFSNLARCDHMLSFPRRS